MIYEAPASLADSGEQRVWSIAHGEGIAPLRPVLSPSLVRTDGLPAHEVKFVLPEETARQVETELASWLQSDPYSEEGTGYATTTLYCDTPALDVFHRSAEFARRKYRLRRYGSSGNVFLERKSKRGTEVRKRRSVVPAEDLRFLASEPTDVSWEGAWFHKLLWTKSLKPRLAVAYDRAAYVGVWAGEGVRATFDRHVRGAIHRDWSVPAEVTGANIFEGRVLCEFKFRGTMPGPFLNLMERLRLIPGAASKYRLCTVAAGLTAAQNCTAMPHSSKDPPCSLFGG